MSLQAACWAVSLRDRFPLSQQRPLELSLLIFKVPAFKLQLVIGTREIWPLWCAEPNVMGIHALQAPRCEDLFISVLCKLWSFRLQVAKAASLATMSPLSLPSLRQPLLHT